MTETRQLIKDYDRYVLNTYTRYPVVMVKGKGSWLWDAEGKKYLDFFPGWGVSALGHCHPKVVKAIRRQAGKLLHMPNNYYSEWQGKLAKVISKKSFPGKCFFCNSGAEANEGAIKLARRFGQENGRHEIVTMQSSFHGRTLAAVTATGQEKYRQGFGPLPPGFKYAPFNKLDELSKLVSDKTAAIMLELIQGEGGINVASPKYAEGVRKICDERDILLIVDEVQTGGGRTGSYFAFQNYAIEPDLMTLAKSLGGGVAIGAFIVKDTFAHLLPPGTHASTFGGNSLACAAGLATFEAIEEENILDNVSKIGGYLRKKLEGFKKKFSFIKEVRGTGVMLGIELGIECKEVVEKCLEKGLIINCTAGRVLRLMPALNISEREVDHALAIIEEVLAEMLKNSKFQAPNNK